MTKVKKSGKALTAKLEESVEHLLRREEQAEMARVYQLALWPDHQRALPTDFLACALFAGVHMKNSRNVRGEELACINGYRLLFTGKLLTQVHADIVMGALQLMRGLPEGSPVRIQTRSFLRSIGRHTGKTDRDSFRQLIDDVIATAVRITQSDGTVSYSGSILTKSMDASNGKDSAFYLEVDRKLARLFESGFGTVDWEQRRALMKKPLALWLQLYLSKFRKPVKIAELQRLSRSSAPLRSFRRQLKLALLELERVGVGKWFVDADDVLRDMDGAHAALPASTVPALAQAEVAAPKAAAGQIVVSDAAKQEFRRRYPQHDFSKCLADFNAWPGSRLARKPDAAFLGFARGWQTEQGAARTRSVR